MIFFDRVATHNGISIIGPEHKPEKALSLTNDASPPQKKKPKLRRSASHPLSPFCNGDLAQQEGKDCEKEQS